MASSASRMSRAPSQPSRCTATPMLPEIDSCRAPIANDGCIALVIARARRSADVAMSPLD
ncbi:hypothetical protein ACVWWW_000022 [Lysobacter sp. HA18]